MSAPKRHSVPSMQIAAEAAVWISRLHGPHRSPQMESECLQWQSQSEAHRQAFERCTATWEAVRGLSVSAAYANAHAKPTLREASVDRRSRWALALATLVIVVLGVLFSMPRGITTGVGERRVVMLDDGSRVTLNTDTRIVVDFSKTRRTVLLDRGEALFEVANDAVRPFAVRAAAGEVVAIGTVFSVRRAGDALAVTLIEGQVAVRSALPESGESVTQQVVLRPGERLSIGGRDASPRVDKPRIDQVTAWKRGEASFDDVSLAEAVAEMNRYSRIHIALADEALASRRVSGVFHTGDNLAFARAVAALHGLTVREQPDRIELARAPAFPDGASLQPQQPAKR